MPNAKTLNQEINAETAKIQEDALKLQETSAFDRVRRKYLKNLSDLTQRNVIVYYSAWLQKGPLLPPNLQGVMALNDMDKQGFMATIHELDRTKGLDLILHTPGGEMAATESLVDYLQKMFAGDIRAIIPQLAMSAGTMIACAAKEIVMGKHSSLGPIDPQIGGMAAHGVIEEFQRAVAEVTANHATIPIWQPIIAKYSPTLIGECEKAISWSNEMVRHWLSQGMFANEADSNARIDRVLQELGNHALTKSHARHISLERASDIGLKIVPLEDDGALQDAVLSVHHACMETLQKTNAIKIIENQNGVAHIAALLVQPGQGQAPPSPAPAPIPPALPS